MIAKGMDFTSVPSRRKPITCVEAVLRDRRLRIADSVQLEDFAAFERVLDRDGPWIAGLDFPFGQSRRLVANLNWPETWEGYVGLVAEMSRREFVDLLEAYKANRPSGDKEHFRVVDRRGHSKSPQKLYYPPVAKMFYEGAKRLLGTNVSIIPVRPTQDRRIVVEAYPALVARRFIGRRSYKHDTRARQTDEREQARRAIVQGLRSPVFRSEFGFRVEFSREQAREWIADARGDHLDSVLCAVQAAWAWTQRDNNFGMPREADMGEGWIADPGLSKARPRDRS